MGNTANATAGGPPTTSNCGKIIQLGKCCQTNQTASGGMGGGPTYPSNHCYDGTFGTQVWNKELVSHRHPHGIGKNNVGPAKARTNHGDMLKQRPWEVRVPPYAAGKLEGVI
jgi:hypothetical protein